MALRRTAGPRAAALAVARVRSPSARRAGHHRHRLTLVAVRLLRQVDDLGDVRELRGELVDPLVDLGRVHVLGDEVLLERGDARRQRLAGPLGRRLLVSIAPVARRHAHRDVAGREVRVGAAQRRPGRGGTCTAPASCRACCRRVAESSPSGVIAALAEADDVRTRRPGPRRPTQRRAGRSSCGLVVRLDVEEAARVVGERVRAHDHGLARDGDGALAPLPALAAVLGELGRERLAPRRSRRSRPCAPRQRAARPRRLRRSCSPRRAAAPPRRRRGRRRPRSARRRSRRRSARLERLDRRRRSVVTLPAAARRPARARRGALRRPQAAIARAEQRQPTTSADHGNPPSCASAACHPDDSPRERI